MFIIHLQYINTPNYNHVNYYLLLLLLLLLLLTPHNFITTTFKMLFTIQNIQNK